MTALPRQSLRTQAPPFLAILYPHLYPGAHLGLKVAVVVPATEMGLRETGSGGAHKAYSLRLRVSSGPRLQRGLTAESADWFLALAPHLGLRGSSGREGRGSAC